GTIALASARMAEILGYAAGRMQGASLLSFVDPSDVPRPKALIERAGTGRTETGLRLRHSDGGAIDARLAASPVAGVTPGCPGVAVAVMDVTAQRVVEEKARHRNVQLYVINQVVRTATSS